MNRLLFIISSLVLSPLIAFAAAVTVTEGISITLPNDGSNYTVSPSVFKLLTINDTNFVFDLEPGDSAELISTDKKNLSNDGSITVECNTNDSRIFMTVPTSGSTKTIKVTPSGSCTTSSTSGGGSPSLGAGSSGSGGGGGTYHVSQTPPPPPTTIPPPAPPPTPVTVTVESISEKISTIQSQIAGLTGIAPSSAPQFTKNLSQGMTNDDVKALQEYLASDPSLYPQGLITGYYGSLTVAAVQRFQDKYDIADSSNPGYGYFGPNTRAKLNDLLSVLAPVQIPAIEAPVPPPTTPPTPAPAMIYVPSALNLTRGFGIGSSGDDVRALQGYLASDPAIYPEGKVTGYYGSLTKEAVAKFQMKYGILSSSADPGYGYVGPKTRQKLNELTPSGAIQTPPPAPSTVPPTSDNTQAQLEAIQAKILETQAKINELLNQ